VTQIAIDVETARQQRDRLISRAEGLEHDARRLRRKADRFEQMAQHAEAGTPWVVRIGDGDG
jgi:hypothetical protein